MGEGVKLRASLDTMQSLQCKDFIYPQVRFLHFAYSSEGGIKQTKDLPLHCSSQPL